MARFTLFTCYLEEEKLGEDTLARWHFLMIRVMTLLCDSIYNIKLSSKTKDFLSQASNSRGTASRSIDVSGGWM